ncbi:type II secretion system F family protein [Cryptosporangium sp. NPDC051539]|uniref:type II secretion system F family protein n=1 Tax=Cryptosporangium sp. NPDC051539 TaxID=3363962 RepID=UPI00378F8437
MSAAGAVIGLGLALGILLVARGVPPARRPRLEDRLAPYLGRAEVTRVALGAAKGPDRSWAAAARSVAELLDRLLGGGRAVQRRLVASGRPPAVVGFRAEQVRWGAIGLVSGVVLAAATGRLPGLGVLGALGAAGGVLGRDWWLSVQVRRRSDAMRAELPVVAELLALAVTAGEAPAAALRRVSETGRGELSRELARALGESRSGAGLITALEALAARAASEPLARFVDGIVIALERGTPLAEVLRAQAADAREAEKRSLLAAGGRREIAMMIPVVFLILPVTVLFALYPGLVSISTLTR